MAWPYTALDDTVSATLIFGMTTLAEGQLPRLFLDDVESMDVMGSGPCESSSRDGVGQLHLQETGANRPRAEAAGFQLRISTS